MKRNRCNYELHSILNVNSFNAHLKTVPKFHAWISWFDSLPLTCCEVVYEREIFSLNLFTAGSYHWQVPVSISSSANPRESVASTLLDQKSCTLTVSGVKSDEWVKVCSITTSWCQHRLPKLYFIANWRIFKSSSFPWRNLITIFNEIVWQ